MFKSPLGAGLWLKLWAERIPGNRFDAPRLFASAEEMR
jgi:hypothetical protein